MIKIQIDIAVHGRLRSGEKRFNREMFPLLDDVFLMVLSSSHLKLFAEYERLFTESSKVLFRSAKGQERTRRVLPSYSPSKTT